MTTTFRSAAIAAMLTAVPVAAAAQTPALEKGSYALGGSAGFSIEDSGSGDNVLTIAAIPRVDYFLVDGLALGGHVGIRRFARGDDSSTSFHLGPVVSYYFVQDGRAHPFVRALASYVHSTFSTAVSDGSSDSMALTGAVGLLYMLSDAVGVDAQLFVRRQSWESSFGGEAASTEGGLQIGFSAFVL
ncbi:MAG: hypothetical protein KY466_10725 [Gemmatimonadetes bacterium]|nr:hypothetical protein [Gemmatimonadota bacterium]